MVKNLPAVQEIWVPSLGPEDPLEKERLPTPVFLVEKSHRRRSLVGYSPWSRKKLDMIEGLNNNSKISHQIFTQFEKIVVNYCLFN